MRDDRAVARRVAMLGVALLVTAFFSLDFADGLAKLMTGSVLVMEIVTAQYLVIMILAPALMARARLVRVHRLPQLRLLLTQSVCQIGVSVAFVWAVKSLPLADVVAIGFMSPFHHHRASGHLPEGNRLHGPLGRLHCLFRRCDGHYPTRVSH